MYSNNYEGSLERASLNLGEGIGITDLRLELRPLVFVCEFAGKLEPSFICVKFGKRMVDIWEHDE